MSEWIANGTLRAAFASLHLPVKKAILAAALGVSATLVAWPFVSPERPILSACLFLPLAWAVVVDIDRQVLPNLITLPMILTGLVLALLLDAERAFDRWLGAAFGYLLLVLVDKAFLWLRKVRGVGRGDAKLLAAAGSWLGATSLSHVVLIASCSALLWVLLSAAVSGRGIQTHQRIAFGPFLALGFWFAWVFLAPS